MAAIYSDGRCLSKAVLSDIRSDLAGYPLARQGSDGWLGFAAFDGATLSGRAMSQNIAAEMAPSSPTKLITYAARPPNAAKIAHRAVGQERQRSASKAQQRIGPDPVLFGTPKQQVSGNADDRLQDVQATANQNKDGERMVGAMKPNQPVSLSLIHI